MKEQKNPRISKIIFRQTQVYTDKKERRYIHELIRINVGKLFLTIFMIAVITFTWSNNNLLIVLGTIVMVSSLFYDIRKSIIREKLCLVSLKKENATVYIEYLLKDELKNVSAKFSDLKFDENMKFFTLRKEKLALRFSSNSIWSKNDLAKLKKWMNSDY